MFTGVCLPGQTFLIPQLLPEGLMLDARSPGHLLSMNPTCFPPFRLLIQQLDAFSEVGRADIDIDRRRL